MIKLSAEFIKGVVGQDAILDSNYPQIAFIGRSNVGKSSTINSLVKQKGLARTSAMPGRTQQINIFLLNEKYYLVDLPGYGFAKVSKADQAWIFKLINWYLFNAGYEQKKIVMIIDAKIGLTHDDLDMLEALEDKRKNFIIVANKVDKIKKADYKKQLQKIKETVGDHKVIPFSAEKGIGVEELIKEILN
jgi:GTP-binding protein